MADHVVIRVVTEPLDHDHDHWCRTCNLATGMRVSYVTRSDVNMMIHTVVICMECRGRDIEINPEPRHCC